MFLVPIILSWLKGFSLRQYAEAAAVAALFVFVLWWDHREIEKGRDQCQAAITAATTKAAAQLDALRAANNPLVIQRHQLDEALSHATVPPVPAVRDCPDIDLRGLRSARSPH